MELFYNELNTDLASLYIEGLQIDGLDIQFVFCADTKALWLGLGQPASGSPIFCCPFCRIHRDSRRTPRSRREPSTLRTLAENKYNFQRYEDDAPLQGQKDDRDNKDYLSVTYKPLFEDSPNGPQNNDLPLLFWIIVPFLHIILRVGKDLYDEGKAIAKILDYSFALALKSMPCLISIRGVEEGTDFYNYVMALRDGQEPEQPKNGPTQQAYQRACESTGTTSQIFFKGSLTGNGASAFCKSDLTSFWREALRTSFVSNQEERDALHKRWEALTEIRSDFRAVMNYVGRNQPVISPEELTSNQQLIDNFMIGYRSMFKTVPPKVHFLEDHCVKQAEYFGHWPGLYDEHGGESCHKEYNEFSKQFRSVGNRETRPLATVTGVTRNHRITENATRPS